MKKIKNLLIGVALALLAIIADKHFLKEAPVKQVTKDWLVVLKMWGLVALFIVMLALLACCASAQTPGQAPSTYVGDVPVFYANIRSIGFDGMTVCTQNNNPYIVIDSTVHQNPYAEKYTLIHELVHVEEIKAVGGCAEFGRLYKHNKRFRFNAEALAYCVAYDAKRKDNRATVSDWFFIIQSLKDLAPKGATTEDIEARIPCISYISLVQKDGTFTRPP